MRAPRDDRHDDAAPSRLLGPAMLMAFALSVLVFLVAIERHALFSTAAAATQAAS